MSLLLEIKTKIPDKEVTKALDEFVEASWKRTSGKAVSSWKKQSTGKYLLDIAYMPQNPISDMMLRQALQGSFRKQDETAKVSIIKERKKNVRKEKGKKNR